ncbi:MAG: hypothetical protein IPI42_03465 [Saprospiraceae bacterium]|nr:hypothetical protein [Candidatus Parvibacillus calidus]
MRNERNNTEFRRRFNQISIEWGIALEQGRATNLEFHGEVVLVQVHHQRYYSKK